MNEITTYYYRRHPVRVIEIDAEKWVIARDVIKALGYSDNTGYFASRVPEVGKRKLFIKSVGGLVWAFNGKGLEVLSSTFYRIGSADHFLHWFERAITKDMRLSSLLAKLFNRVKVALARAAV